MAIVYASHTPHVNATHTNGVAPDYRCGMRDETPKRADDASKKKAFGARLRAARTNAKLTQAQVGSELGVNKVTVSSWELGHNFPDPLTLGRLAKLYGVTIDLLVWDDGISVEAIQIAVQYEALTPAMRRTFNVMWAAYFQQAVDDGDVGAAIERGTGPIPTIEPARKSLPKKSTRARS